MAYNGYSAATPSNPGHVFATTDGGAAAGRTSAATCRTFRSTRSRSTRRTRTRSTPRTDVGPMVTYDGGAHWALLGSGMPTVAVWQIEHGPAAPHPGGRHARARRLPHRRHTARPCRRWCVTKVDAGVPVGPASNLDYTITVQNIGNGDATGVTHHRSDAEEHELRVRGRRRHAVAAASVTWSGLTRPAGRQRLGAPDGAGSTRSSRSKVTSDHQRRRPGHVRRRAVHDRLARRDDDRAGLRGQRRAGDADRRRAGRQQRDVPRSTSRTSASRPTATRCRARAARTPVSFLDSTCTTPRADDAYAWRPATSTTSASRSRCPADATDGETNTATVTATSVGNPSTSASATVKTIAVTKDTLLVDEDGNAPDVQSLLRRRADARPASRSHVGPRGDQHAAAGLPDRPPERRLVHRQQLPRPAPARTRASSRRSSTAAGTCSCPGRTSSTRRPGRRRSCTTTCTSPGTGPRPRTTSPPTNVHGVSGSPVTDGIGTVPLDHSVLGDAFMDQITPNGGAAAGVHGRRAARPDALSYADPSGYKVVFAAFPIEEYGTAADKADLDDQGDGLLRLVSRPSRPGAPTRSSRPPGPRYPSPMRLGASAAGGAGVARRRQRRYDDRLHPEPAGRGAERRGRPWLLPRRALRPAGGPLDVPRVPPHRPRDGAAPPRPQRRLRNPPDARAGTGSSLGAERSARPKLVPAVVQVPRTGLRRVTVHVVRPAAP